ncbi:MAG TPA: epoxide hydrolase, partial [Stellaceae bacterium]|nr:epoxide hydrolase [Stellaceae bacterium]
MQIEPFRIAISDAAIADLKDRLARTRWPDQPVDAGDWALGTDLAYLRELTEYWRTRFDWRAQERMLNAFPQFRAGIGEETIHFLHVRGKGPKPLPLVVTHGWPGSVAEMVKFIPLLADPAAHGGDAADAFDVVVPSLPGYGFSSKPKRRGMSTFAVAALWKELMEGLGYPRFGAQGGDWGSAVSICLG